MSYPLQLRKFTIQGTTIEIYVPEPAVVQRRYETDHFPYWSQVWPSSIALSDFLLRHPEAVEDKDVVELAAGLGLPSLLAAKYARHVRCSDYLLEPVEIVNASAAHLGKSNLAAEVQDWAQFTNEHAAQVVMASDINYAPASFPLLHHLFLGLLHAGVTILLSTPHRIAGRTFVAPLLPYCSHQEIVEVATPKGEEEVSVLTLEWKNSAERTGNLTG